MCVAVAAVREKCAGIYVRTRPYACTTSEAVAVATCGVNAWVLASITTIRPERGERNIGYQTQLRTQLWHAPIIQERSHARTLVAPGLGKSALIQQRRHAKFLTKDKDNAIKFLVASGMGIRARTMSLQSWNALIMT